MPEVKSKMTGKTVAKMSYDEKGMDAANKMVANDPGLVVTDGRNRSQQMYEGGGMTGMSMIGKPQYMKGGKMMYKHGGKTHNMKEMGHGGMTPEMKKYEEGGLAGDLNGDGKLSIAEKNKLKIAKIKTRMEEGIKKGTKKRKKVKEGVKKTVKKVKEGVNKFLEDKNLKPTFKKRELSEREQSAKDKRAERRAARKAARDERRAARKAARAKRKQKAQAERDAMKAKKDKKPAAKKPAAKKPVVSQPNKQSAFERNQAARDALKRKKESREKSKRIVKESKNKTFEFNVPKINQPKIGLTIGKSKK